jgi:hypothetical protein
LVIAGLVAAVAKVRHCAILAEITGDEPDDTALSFALFRGNRGHPGAVSLWRRARSGRNNPPDIG